MTRDHTRTDSAKARTMSRRKARVSKSARLFMAIAFPADLGGFTPASAR